MFSFTSDANFLTKLNQLQTANLASAKALFYGLN